jgi:hypothetical protein
MSTRDPRACPTCGLWQRTASAAAVCLDSAHDGQRAPEGPEDGHTWLIAVRSRSSSKVVGDPTHHDAEEFDAEPMTLQVRGWSLAEALAKAAHRGLAAWTMPDDLS